LNQINEITLWRARLVLRRVTVCGMKPTNLVDSAFYPLWDGKMSTGIITAIPKEEMASSA